MDCRRRRRHHMKTLRSGKHDNPRMQLVYNKYGGDAFSFEVVENCLPDQLSEFEQWWLDFMRGSAFVMNIAFDATSPNRGRKFSSEVRGKVSAASTGRSQSIETRQLRSLSMRGRTLSVESRAKMSSTKLERQETYRQQIGSDHHASRPVVGLPVGSGDEIHLEAMRHGRSIGFDPSAIRRSCIGQIRQYKGYVWSFAVDHNLLDGYDGAQNPPPPDFIARLLAGAPDEIKARAQEFASQRAGGGQASEKKTGQ
mgnify:FL=1